MSCCWGFLTLMNTQIIAGQLFTYFLAVGGSAAYITWSVIVFTHLRVRSGLVAQGIDLSTLPFKAFGSIWIYRFNLFLNIFILFVQGFTSLETPFNWRTFLSSYIMIPAFVVFFTAYKMYHNTRW